jgi:hypothetical protein
VAEQCQFSLESLLGLLGRFLVAEPPGRPVLFWLLSWASSELGISLFLIIPLVMGVYCRTVLQGNGRLPSTRLPTYVNVPLASTSSHSRQPWHSLKKKGKKKTKKSSVTGVLLPGHGYGIRDMETGWEVGLPPTFLSCTLFLGMDISIFC